MKHLLCTAGLVLLAVAVRAQGTPNAALKKELDSLFVVDQRYRIMMGFTGTRLDSLASAVGVTNEQLPEYLVTQMHRVDSSNLVRIEQIIQQYGYPGKTLVGTPANETTFYVIQHSPKIKEYLPLVEKAARKGELPFYLYAMMYDRHQMYEGKEQLYGTQARGFAPKGPDGRPGQMQMFIWPIKDPATVNRRRKEAGFTDTVEENARRMRIEYKVITLEEAKAIEKNASGQKQ